MISYTENEAKNEKQITYTPHNRTRPGDGYKFTNYKLCLSRILVMCNKQYLSNISSWILEKVKDVL